MSLATMLRSVCTISRDTATKDAAGGKVQALTAVYTDQPCDIQPARSNVILEYRQRELRITHSIYFAVDVAVRQNFKVTSGSRTFNVIGYRPGGAGYGEWPAILDVEELPS